MKDKTEQGALGQVRAARRRVSEQFGHDPRKLVEHYIKMQEQYRERLIEKAEEVGRERAA